MERTRKTIGRRLSIPKLKKDKRTLQKMVYEHIRREIIRGTLKWGERLSEDSLACSFNVSRTPVREAIFQLVQEGLVTKQPHNCFYVRKFSQAEIEEIFRLRSVLEPLIMEIVIEKIDDSVIAELQDNLNRCQTLLQKGDMEKVLTVDCRVSRDHLPVCGQPQVAGNSARPGRRYAAEPLSCRAEERGASEFYRSSSSAAGCLGGERQGL